VPHLSGAAGEDLASLLAFGQQAVGLGEGVSTIQGPVCLRELREGVQLAFAAHLLQ